MEYSIQMQNVCKSYNSFAVKDISLRLPQGSIMGLIGENGSGKTTLIKLILNMITADEGSICVFGMDNEKYNKEIKSLIGYVPDDMTIFDMFLTKDVNYMMKGIYSNWNETLFYEYLERFSIPIKEPIKNFSLGTKKKLMIATALCHDAKVLLLDEPMNGLDPVVRNEMLDIYLDFIQEEDHSILLSSHITEDLEKICDYITFIQNGKMIFSKNKDLILEEYGLMKCKKSEIHLIDEKDIMQLQETAFGCNAFVKNRLYLRKKYPNIMIEPVNLEDIMVFFARRDNK